MQHDTKNKVGKQNLRTALALLSIAILFFLGVVLKYWLLG